MSVRGRLKKEWKRRGYDTSLLASATIAPPPPEGFIRGYHLTSLEHGKSDISHRQLKIARFSDLNDPFELIALNFHERNTRIAARMYKKDQHDRIGLLCFSTNWKSPLLWSHYAEKHRGLCLGFDLRASTMQAVKYEDQRLRVEMGAQDGDAVKIPGELKALLLKTKARCWKYEGETRRFIRLSEAELDNQLYFWPFSDDMRLIEVIIGSECRRLPSEIERITNSVNPGIYVSKARLAWRSFTIVPDGKHLSSKLT